MMRWKYWKIDLAIIFFLLLTIVDFGMAFAWARMSFPSQLICILFPFFFPGSFVWAIALFIYRIHLMEKERQMTNLIEN